MTWNDIEAKYGQFITLTVEDSQSYSCELQTSYASHADADRVLGRVSNKIAAHLRPINEGVSDQSGTRRYYVAHAGSLTGSQYKEYLLGVVAAGGEIWEAFAR